MKNYLKMALIGAIAGAVIATVFFKVAYASPTPEEDNNKLEQLVSQNDACRLIVYQYHGGMIRLYFPNKSEAELAVQRMYKQVDGSRGGVREVYFLSPDCDINLDKP